MTAHLTPSGRSPPEWRPRDFFWAALCRLRPSPFASPRPAPQKAEKSCPLLAADVAISNWRGSVGLLDDAKERGNCMTRENAFARNRRGHRRAAILAALVTLAFPAGQAQQLLDGDLYRPPTLAKASAFLMCWQLPVGGQACNLASPLVNFAFGDGSVRLVTDPLPSILLQGAGPTGPGHGMIEMRESGPGGRLVFTITLNYMGQQNPFFCRVQGLLRLGSNGKLFGRVDVSVYASLDDFLNGRPPMFTNSNDWIGSLP